MDLAVLLLLPSGGGSQEQASLPYCNSRSLKGLVAQDRGISSSWWSRVIRPSTHAH